MDQPSVLMVAGPNGSGKTTLVKWLQSNGIDLGEHINPDDIAAGLVGSYAERVAEAQKIADRRREECLEARRSFSFETVMSHPSKIEFLARAKRAGLFVQLAFVGIDDPRTNVDRVRLRVAQGGHDVPRDRIERRWYRTMGLLEAAIKTVDKSLVFDNSAVGTSTTGPRLVFRCTMKPHGKLASSELFPPIPEWVRRYALDPLSI